MKSIYKTSKVIALFLMLSLIFASCTKEKNIEVNNPITKPKLSIDDIKKTYTDEKIKDIRNINNDYVLIESQRDTLANRFVLYNLITGEKEALPTSAEFVTIDKIVNENNIILLANGKNSESPFVKFPYLINCIRVKNDTKGENNFIAINEEKTFKLNESVQAGSKNDCLLADIITTVDGIQVLFKPILGKEISFYADDVDIPVTTTKYNESKKQLVFEIRATQIADSLKTSKYISNKNNPYISSIEITNNNGLINIAVNLMDSVNEYKININKSVKDVVFFETNFIGSNNQ